jgi:hypothetical protein
MGFLSSIKTAFKDLIDPCYGGATGQTPPRRNPTEPSKHAVDNVIQMVRLSDVDCPVDETCGFPLHLEDTADGHKRYGAHEDVKVYGDQTICNDCGQAWDTNDIDPPATCSPKSLGRFLDDETWESFPFKRPEVTSESDDPGHLIALEKIAQNYAQNWSICAEHSLSRLKAELFYDMANWLRGVAFIPSEQGPRQELARVVAQQLQNKESCAEKLAAVVLDWALTPR